jgi:putative tricarboxylic transport membrane protein
VVNIIMLILAWYGSPYFALVSKVPNYLLHPAIFILCAVGTYVINSNFFEIATMLFFGVVGYVIRKLEMPVGPFLIAFILGPLFESNLRRAMILFDNNIALVFTRPIAVFFFILAAISLVFILKNQAKISRIGG